MADDSVVRGKSVRLRGWRRGLFMVGEHESLRHGKVTICFSIIYRRRGQLQHKTENKDITALQKSIVTFRPQSSLPHGICRPEKSYGTN